MNKQIHWHKKIQNLKLYLFHYFRDVASPKLNCPPKDKGNTIQLINLLERLKIIHAFNKYFLNTFSVSGAMLSSECTIQDRSII